MLGTLTVAVALAWVKANGTALVAGFVARHLSPAALTTVKALLAKAHDKVQAALAWAHSKL